MFSVVKLCYNNEISSHFLYIKQHCIQKKSDLLPEDRTLFVLNIPPLLNEKDLKNAFPKICAVERVILTNKPKIFLSELDLSKDDNTFGFKIAYVVFKKVIGLKKALKLETLNVNLENRFGLKKWMNDYNSSIDDVKLIKEKINGYFKEFDKRKEAEKKELKNKKGVNDDEGWTTVTKYDRKRPIGSYLDTTDVNSANDLSESKRSKKKELLNFYTFQIRESKMKSLEELRQKFEQDKQLINTMRKSGKFKIKF